MATATHAARARNSQRPRRVVGGGETCVLNLRSCSLAPAVTVPPYGTTVSRTLRNALRAGPHGNLPGKTSANLGSIRSRRADLLPGQVPCGPQGSVPVFASRARGALRSTTET